MASRISPGPDILVSMMAMNFIKLINDCLLFTVAALVLHWCSPNFYDGGYSNFVHISFPSKLIGASAY